MSTHGSGIPSSVRNRKLGIVANASKALAPTKDEMLALMETYKGLGSPHWDPLINELKAQPDLASFLQSNGMSRPQAPGQSQLRQGLTPQQQLDETKKAR